MKEITPEEIELANAFEEEIKDKNLEEAIIILNQKRPTSSLIRSFCASIPDLVSLDFLPFAKRLRAETFRMEPLDIELIYNVALSKLDYTAGEKNNSAYLIDGKKHCSTKHLGLPLLIFFEYVAQDFGVHRKNLTNLFEKYVALTGNSSPYSSQEERQHYILPVGKDQPIEDKLKMLTMRPDAVLETGRFRYKGKPVLSKAEAENIEFREMVSWLKRFKEANITTAQDAIGLFHRKMIEGMDLKEEVMSELKRYDGTVGDYLQPVTELWLCGVDIERYASYVEIKIEKRLLPF